LGDERDDRHRSTTIIGSVGDRHKASERYEQSTDDFDDIVPSQAERRGIPIACRIAMKSSAPRESFA